MTADIIVLDRDGTINLDTGYVSELAQVQLLPNACAGLRILSDNGFRFVVISNQSGVGRGYFTLSRLDSINKLLRDMLAAEGVQLAGMYCCPHVPSENCGCRKPAPLLMLRAAADLKFDPSKAVVIGDKELDIQFGGQFGAATVRIAGPGSSFDSKADYLATDLLEAAHWILARKATHRR